MAGESFSIEWAPTLTGTAEAGDIALAGVDTGGGPINIVEPEAIKYGADIMLAGMDAALKQSQLSTDIQGAAIRSVTEMSKQTQAGESNLLMRNLIIGAVIVLVGWFFFVKRRG